MPDKPEKIDLATVTYDEEQTDPADPKLAAADGGAQTSIPPQFKPVLGGLESAPTTGDLATPEGAQEAGPHGIGDDQYEDEDLPAGDGGGSPPLMTFQWGDTPPLGDDEVPTLVSLNQTEAGEMLKGELSINGDLELSSDVFPADVDADFGTEV